VPYGWRTDLSDEQVRALWLLLYLEWGAAERSDSPTPGAFTFTVKRAEVDFEGGVCRCMMFNDVIVAVLRTDDEWTRVDAQCAEERARQASLERSRTVESWIRQDEDDWLRESIQTAIDMEDYATADLLFKRRLDAWRSREAETGGTLAAEWFLRPDGIEMYATFPSTEPGIQFLLASQPRAFDFLQLAESYMTCNRASAGQRMDEVERVFTAGVQALAMDPEIYKSAALFWRRHGHLDRAIAYCEQALVRRLHDDTQSGFRGRLQRLRREADRRPARSAGSGDSLRPS
jgi:hypothetical protein